MTTRSEEPQIETSHDDGPPGGSVDLGRLGWVAIVGTLLVGMIVLALKRDWGYAAVSLAVAISAAINLL